MKTAELTATSCDAAADHIRPFLYQLYQGTWNFEVADLGNIYSGERHVDTILHLQDFVRKCSKGIITITIGGSQDLTYANYRAYDNLKNG